MPLFNCTHKRINLLCFYINSFTILLSKCTLVRIEMFMTHAYTIMLFILYIFLSIIYFFTEVFRKELMSHIDLLSLQTLTYVGVFTTGTEWNVSQYIDNTVYVYRVPNDAPLLSLEPLYMHIYD